MTIHPSEQPLEPGPFEIDAARAPGGAFVPSDEHLRPPRSRYHEALICQELRRLRAEARTAR